MKSLTEQKTSIERLKEVRHGMFSDYYPALGELIEASTTDYPELIAWAERATKELASCLDVMCTVAGRFNQCERVRNLIAELNGK